MKRAAALLAVATLAATGCGAKHERLGRFALLRDPAVGNGPEVWRDNKTHVFYFHQHWVAPHITAGILHGWCSVEVTAVRGHTLEFPTTDATSRDQPITDPWMLPVAEAALRAHGRTIRAPDWVEAFDACVGGRHAGRR